jgi:hypothetical protein
LNLRLKHYAWMIFNITLLLHWLIFRRGSPGIRLEKWIRESLITESLPNVILDIRLDNEDWIVDDGLGRIHCNV